MGAPEQKACANSTWHLLMLVSLILAVMWPSAGVHQICVAHGGWRDTRSRCVGLLMRICVCMLPPLFAANRWSKLLPPIRVHSCRHGFLLGVLTDPWVVTSDQHDLPSMLRICHQRQWTLTNSGPSCVPVPMGPPG